MYINTGFIFFSPTLCKEFSPALNLHKNFIRKLFAMIFPELEILYGKHLLIPLLFFQLIVPPSWIVKVPRKSSFKSSLKNSPNKKKHKKKVGAPTSLANEGNDHDDTKERPFCLKPIPSPGVAPILVFLNPKSGGNQGAKLMQKFQWLLNPRQVFDLTDGGPGQAIEMFRHVPNIKLLACGGDGTVGWLLSVLDKITIDPMPPVGVLPLGMY